ncbi:hypothetical protein RQP46_006088 [Phenoliferia psychrophenolica]
MATWIIASRLPKPRVSANCDHCYTKVEYIRPPLLQPNEHLLVGCANCGKRFPDRPSLQAVTTDTNKTIHDLPTELLLKIFHHLPLPRLRASITNHAWVCKQWREIAQAIVMGTVELNSDECTREWMEARRAVLPSRYSATHLKLSIAGHRPFETDKISEL